MKKNVKKSSSVPLRPQIRCRLQRTFRRCTPTATIFFVALCGLAALSNPASAANDDAEAPSQGPTSTNNGGSQPESVESQGEQAKENGPESSSNAGSIPQTSAQTADDAKPAPDFHAQTPEGLKDRLRLAAGLSLGKGFGPTADFSSDFLGFYLAGQYTFHAFPLAGLPFYWVASAKYASFTGVDTKRSYDTLVQRFLLGGGTELIRENAVFRPGVTLHVGLLKASGASIKTTSAPIPYYRPALSVEPYARYRIAPKIWILAGADLSPLLGYSWYGLNLGATFSF